MRWISRLLDAIFKHLYTVCAGIFLSALAVLLILMSAQYLGGVISDNVLNNRTIEILLFKDDKNNDSNSTELDRLFDVIANNYNLRNYHVKVKKIDLTQKFLLKKGARLLVSTNKDFMEKLSQERKLAILDRSMFVQRTHKYIEFSKYDEYVLAETTTNHLKVYIAITNAETNTERTKSFRILNVFSDNFVRKVDLQPDP